MCAGRGVSFFLYNDNAKDFWPRKEKERREEGVGWKKSGSGGRGGWKGRALLPLPLRHFAAVRVVGESARAISVLELV